MVFSLNNFYSLGYFTASKQLILFNGFMKYTSFLYYYSRTQVLLATTSLSLIQGLIQVDPGGLNFKYYIGGSDASTIVPTVSRNGASLYK